MKILLELILAAVFFGVSLSAMPQPFYRELFLTDPPLTGDDVTIAQTLLKRDSAVKSLNINGVFDKDTQSATLDFQSANSLKSNGILDSDSVTVLMNLHEADGYKDSGFTAASMGYKYKVHIPVYTNRSIETYATLFDKDNNVLLKFKVRTHGKRSDGTASAWPDYGVNDFGLNQFSSSGNTVTGLVEMDLNTPEPTPAVYGPWPVNRVVRGLAGNALTLLPNIRDGLLIHTGNWTTETVNWNPSKDMPNSSGCIHGHPSDVERIYKVLEKQGVIANENTFSGKNYPYKPQGIAVIELVNN